MKKSYIVAIIIASLNIGCSSVVKVPKEVYIPVKCKIDKTIPPTNKAINEKDYKGIKANNDAILVYTEIIEEDINFCIGGETK